MPHIRLFVDTPLAPRLEIPLEAPQAHYVQHVMRLRAGDALSVFNGVDGEWRAKVADLRGKKAMLVAEDQVKRQRASPDMWLCFAPIKHGRIEWLVEKATELGVSVLQPVMTRHTIVQRVNLDRLRAHAIEAAEQSERMDVPVCRAPLGLAALLAEWPGDRTLIYCDESGQGKTVKNLLPMLPPSRYAIIIGPEGGFAREEHAMLRAHASAQAMCMGPRVMRADTAALAALANVQAWLGDWDRNPSFTGD
jgi:16S rRNA (uracil1498-N3)-methyltransferase